MPADSNPLPKTLIVDLSKNYGGSNSRVLSLMSHAGPGKIALAGLEFGAITRQACRLGLPVHIVSRHRINPLIIPRLVSIIRQEGYQILDTQNIQSKFWASFAASLTNTTLISTINSWYSNEHGQSSIKGRIYTALELATNWGLDLYITVSEKDRQNLLRSKIAAEDIELIYNAVEINSSAILSEPQWLHAKFNLPLDSIVCAAVGRLVPIKGYDVLIEAVQQIASQIPQLVCLIVGDGESRITLNSQIQNAGLENRVILAGYYERETVLTVLKSCDIFVMPSRYEGTPIALLEAAALACPILASSSGGIPELVTHQEHALLVPPGDPAALAQGLVKLALDRNFARMLGQNAQQRVRQSFNLDSQVHAVWKAYMKAWKRHNRLEK